MRRLYKIILAAIVVAVVFGLFLTLNVFYQRHQIVETATNGAFRVSETVRRSLWHAMMDAQQENIREILSAVGGQDGIEKIRIFSKSGEIIFSTEQNEEGTLVNIQAESCLACHSRIPPQTVPAKKERVRIFQTARGLRVLGLITPIPNEPTCSAAACHVHPGSQPVLGVLDIVMSLAEEDRALARYQRQIIGLGLLFILLAILGVSLIVQRYYVAPVRKLLLSSRGGDAGRAKPAAPGEDEVQALFEVFQRMSSEIKATRDQLILSERLSSVGRVASSIAHEVNNPLTSILTTSSMLMEDLPEDDPRQRQMKTLLDETLRAREILRRMLDLARPAAVRRELSDLNLVILRSIQLMRNYMEVLNTKAETDLDPRLPRIEANPSQMQQVILNLLLNAVDAMPRGGVVRLETRYDSEPGQVEIRCADTGKGMTAEERARIFQAFFTTKGEAGTGLGLAITREIIEDHQGTIAVESEKGKGSSFRIRLPVPRYVKAQATGTAGAA